MIPCIGAPEDGRRYRVRPGVYAVLPRAGRILLTHQERPVAEFQLPGGGIDGREQPLAALYREVLEETGWRIARPRKLGIYRRFTYMPEYDLWAEKVCHVYLSRPVARAGKPAEPHHTAHWLATRSARKALANGAERAFLLAVGLS